MKKHWTRYLPELLVHIDMLPIFSLHTDAMYQRYDSMTRSFLCVRISIFKWRWSFDTYYKYYS